MEMGKLLSGSNTCKIVSPNIIISNKGFVLNDIVLNINQSVSGKMANQLYSFATHDYFIGGMQKLLGTSNIFANPNFASAFVFELRKDKCDQYFVKVLYKNDVYPGGVILDPVKVKECNSVLFGDRYLCPLKQFIALTSDKVLTNSTVACQSNGIARELFTYHGQIRD